MNRPTERSRTTLFLIELAIALGVFAFCAAVCLGVFGTAKRLTRESEALNGASVAAQSAAECYKAADGDLAACAALLEAKSENGVLMLNYDENWRRTAENAAFVLVLTPREDRHAEVTVFAAGSDAPVFSLTASCFGEEVQP